MLRPFVLTILLSAACAGALERRSTFTSDTSTSRERLLEGTDESYCIWEDNKCALTSDFVVRLPKILGAAATRSASILAAAALRGVACANFAGQPECLAAVSYNCQWDAVRSSCGLADLLDTDTLSGAAYCPGSRMEAAVNCSLLTASSEEACSSSPYNCTVAQVAQMTGDGAGGLAAALGDRLYGMVANTMLGVVVKSSSGADSVASAITSLLAGLLPPQLSTVKACVPRWFADAPAGGGLLGRGKDLLKGDGSLLSRVLGPDLLGDCPGVQQLRDLVDACPAATSRPSCEALRGCGWVDVADTCSVAADLLPSLLLDPKDRWVTLLRNASAACGSLQDDLSCANTHKVKSIIANVGNAAGITNGGGQANGGGSGNASVSPAPSPASSGTGQPFRSSGGAGDNGGGAAPSRGVVSWGALVALAVAAVVGLESVRRV